LQVLAKRLIEAACHLNQEPIVDAHLQFELVALHEIVSILVFVGRFRHAPVIGAAIFELDLALFDIRFLDLELDQGGLGVSQGQPRRRNGGDRQHRRQVLQLSL